ncbi:APC family permease [Streptosporangium sp. NBC_01639]|uniref:APC family permease n=1 Tax=Streptosporangium sp. NBC_01639 TaxID=2975948 RepID=UPI0038666795|nr:APC family permease [Streptosporangium sp. NBC_01639]
MGESRSLARNAIGTADLTFLVVAAAAPLTVMAGVAPLAISIGGIAAPLGYLLSGVVVGLFAAGFTAMSGHVRNAGAFYAYVGRGLGRPAGLGAAYVAVISYNLIGIGLTAVFGVFAASTAADVFHLSVPWQVWTLLCVAVVGVLGYLKIALSAKVLGIALALEVLILLVFEAAVLADGAPLSGQSFNPAGLLSGGAGGMFVLSIGAFIGFEATAIYAEEARDPQRTVPRATYAAVAFLAIFYTFTVWMIINAVGAGRAVSVASGAGGADMVFASTADFAGRWAADVMHLLIVTSCFAAALAFHNASTRYFYVLGREGVLPRPLARISPRQGSPAAAVALQCALTLIVIMTGIIIGSDPYTVIFLWTNGTGIVGVMALQALTALSVVAFFRGDRRGYGAARVVVMPAAAFLLLIAIICLVLADFTLLTNAATAVNVLLVAPIPLVFGIGVVLAARIHRRDPARYAVLTGTDLEEPVHV